MWNIDLTGLYYLAVVGLIAIVLSILVGVPAILWWIVAHVRIV